MSRCVLSSEKKNVFVLLRGSEKCNLMIFWGIFFELENGSMYDEHIRADVSFTYSPYAATLLNVCL